ncbi:MAG: KEOPS complex subunit Cgi121 [Candidatus Thorarchaeota archaeon]
MYQTTLVSDRGVLFVAIGEITNEHQLNTEQLLEIVTNLSSNIKALQLFDGSKIVDSNHLLSASQNAINAWHGGYAQSRSLSVEIAVFASGQHQIGRALSLVGVSDDLPSVAVVIIAEGKNEIKRVLDALINDIGKQCEHEFPPDLERFENIMELFGIGKSEVNVFGDLENPGDFQAALSKCVVSRISSVAFDI